MHTKLKLQKNAIKLICIAATSKYVLYHIYIDKLLSDVSTALQISADNDEE